MKTNLLKLKRKHPILFELFYEQKIIDRKVQRTSKKLSKEAISLLKQKADEYWGWDIDRNAYDACIIAAHMISEFSKQISDENN